MMSTLLNTFLILTAILIIFIGLVGIVIPVLPGLLLIWGVILGYALYTDFATIGMAGFIVITIIALVTGTADFWLPLIGAKTQGAKGRSLIFGIIGALIGTIIFPLFGTLIGYMGGILFSEYQTYNDWDKAWQVGKGILAGQAAAIAIQFIGAFLMLTIFGLQLLIN